MAKNEKAPDASLVTSRGESVKLSDYWTKSPVALVFLRHYG